MLNDKNILVHRFGLRCELSQDILKCEANHKSILFCLCFLKGFTTLGTGNPGLQPDKRSHNLGQVRAGHHQSQDRGPENTPWKKTKFILSSCMFTLYPLHTHARTHAHIFKNDKSRYHGILLTKNFQMVYPEHFQNTTHELGYPFHLKMMAAASTEHVL